MAKRPPHRPHGCSRKRIDLIVQALMVCASNKDAAGFAGITATTFNSWQNRGKAAFEAAGLEPDELVDEGDPIDDGDRKKREPEWLSSMEEKERPFAVFLGETRRARAAAAVGILANIRQAARVDWKAGAKLLAIRDPANYAERRLHEHSGSKSDAAPVRIVVETQAPIVEDVSGEHEVAADD